MISAFLQIEGVLAPGHILLARPVENGRSKVLFRISNPIDRGRSLVLQTSDGQCLECVTAECTQEGEYHVIELRCIGSASFLAAPPSGEG